MKPRLRADWVVSIEVEELWIFESCEFHSQAMFLDGDLYQHLFDFHSLLFLVFNHGFDHIHCFFPVSTSNTAIIDDVTN